MNEHCREVLERAYAMMDGVALPADEKDEIELHLHECSPCYQRFGIEREVKVVIARLRGCTPCPDGLRSKIERLIDLEG